MVSDFSYRKQNAAAWNRLADGGSQFARVATDEECGRPLETLDTRGWLPKSVDGLNVLCLAAGGGWQSILYASAGANVTVVDISAAMLKRDEQEAARRNLSLRLVEGSMDDLSALESASFDIVHQPVSTCYISDVATVYREIARVLRDSGMYISQHKQPTSLQADVKPSSRGYELIEPYYREGPLPPVVGSRLREEGTLEYLHRWEELIGLLCRAGFVVEDLVEPMHADQDAEIGSFGHRGGYVAPYVRIKARRTETKQEPGGESKIWTP